MVVGDFLESLLESGEPTFESALPSRDLGKPAEKTRRVLVEMDRRFRRDAPGLAPAFDPVVAHRAAGVLARLCQFLAFREIPRETIEEEGKAWEEFARSEREPGAIWSADLSLRYLPDVDRLVRVADERDPLAVTVRKLARDRALSGIGVAAVDWGEADFSPILEHPCLTAILVDRVIEHSVHELAALPEVAERIREATGHWGEELLDPGLMEVITPGRGGETTSPT